MGDDAAVFRQATGKLGVVTTDALVESVHFDRAYTPLGSLGWKAMAINFSDLAAMGSMPTIAVVTLALSPPWDSADVESLYTGMLRCAGAYDCHIVGGDTVASPLNTMIALTVFGEVEENRYASRLGAEEGDLICVTGELGGSRLGLEKLSTGVPQGDFPESVSRFLEPQPRLYEARLILDAFPVTSMIDISDGLASEIGHLCRQNRLGCRINELEIPVTDEVRRGAPDTGLEPHRYALYSGEEYELLFTVPREEFSERAIPDETRITVLGEMVSSEEGMRVSRDSHTERLEINGWDHFKR